LKFAWPWSLRLVGRRILSEYVEEYIRRREQRQAQMGRRLRPAHQQGEGPPDHQIAITIEIYTEVVSSATQRRAPQARRPARPLMRLLQFAAASESKRPDPDRIEPVTWSPFTESNRRPSPYHKYVRVRR
jgi:hypothetical protein